MKRKWTTIFEDDYMHVINKPAGLLTLPDRYKPDLPNVYRDFQRMNEAYQIVHRLDRDTSGLLVLAKDAETHRALNQQFAIHEVRKTYSAILEGRLLSEKTVENYLVTNANHKVTVSTLSGKWSISHFRPVEIFQGWTLAEVEIETGRTHQIRVHAGHIGHPVICDPLYGRPDPLTIEMIKPKANSNNRDSSLMGRTALHAQKLEFRHPIHDEVISLDAPWPKDFKASINQLRKWRKDKG